MNRIIVSTGGGKRSLWCAQWALENYPKEQVVLYFADTNWNHPDLYRYLKDFSEYIGHPIYHDKDGRTPVEVCIENKTRPSKNFESCCYALKSVRLMNFFNHADTVVFGLGNNEVNKSKMFRATYDLRSMRSKKNIYLKFPLIENKISDDDINKWYDRLPIKNYKLLDLNMPYIHCAGGCLIMTDSKKWNYLQKNLPAIYKERRKAIKLLQNHRIASRERLF